MVGSQPLGQVRIQAWAAEPEDVTLAVLEADDGFEAIILVTSEVPDLILADWRYPS